MLGRVKEANFFIAFEITLMQTAMIQASCIMLTCVISLLLTLSSAAPPTPVITMISQSKPYDFILIPNIHCYYID